MNSQLPAYLNTVELTRLQFTLEMQDDIELTLSELLSLRRNILEAARTLEEQNGADYSSLLKSSVSPDPETVRRFQKPAPPLVLEIDPEMTGKYICGDHLKLGVMLPGNAISQAHPLTKILIRLGEIGLNKGHGRFELVGIESLRPDGSTQPVWQEGASLRDLEFSVDPFLWWCDDQPVNTVTLEFMTPARLMSAGKPLFRPTFKDIFPYILRRVGSHLAHYCYVEIDSPQALLNAAQRLHAEYNDLRWQDWKCFSARIEHRELGGITGSIRCSGAELEILWWVLRLGELLNVGKGASWGAGRFRLKLSE